MTTKPITSDQLPIDAPCDANWDRMSGDASKRFCGLCNKNVHDLSAMTRDEAVALLRAASNPCVRYQCTSAGDVQFQPAQRQRTLPQLRSTLRMAAMVGLSVLGGPAYADSPNTESTRTPGIASQIADWIETRVDETIRTLKPPPTIIDTSEVLMGAVAIPPIDLDPPQIDEKTPPTNEVVPPAVDEKTPPPKPPIRMGRIAPKR